MEVVMQACVNQGNGNAKAGSRRPRLQPARWLSPYRNASASVCS